MIQCITFERIALPFPRIVFPFERITFTFEYITVLFALKNHYICAQVLISLPQGCSGRHVYLGGQCRYGDNGSSHDHLIHLRIQLERHMYRKIETFKIFIINYSYIYLINEYAQI